MKHEPGSRHFWQRACGRDRGRPGYAEVTATLALVLAMSGGAVAANHYLISSSKQIKPSVLRHLRGARGPRGATGPKGSTGLTGAPGGTGATGQPGPAGVGIDGLFGNGADGNQTIAANTALTRDSYYHDLTVSSGVTLNPGGFRIFVSGTLTLQSGARISRDGNDASASGPPAGLTAGSLGGSGPGANHGLCAGGSAANSLGGTGGTGGTSCPGGPATAPAASVGGPQAFDAALQALSGRTLDGAIVSGGSGGGGGSTSSDNGGAGGGVVIIAARSVIVTSTATISAIGGANSGDGGGGGGGVVVVVSTSPQPPGLALSAAGGGGSPHTGSAGFATWLS